jgi:flagellar assembly factor FliW
MTPIAHALTSAAVAAPFDGLPQISNEVVRFPHGLPGFESCRGFVLMASEAFGPLQCLKSVAGPETSFLVIDPRRVLPDYRCALTEVDRRRLAVTQEDTLLWLSLVTIELDGTITVNLRAPVVINPAQMLGHQVVPSDTVYPIRHVVAAGG